MRHATGPTDYGPISVAMVESVRITIENEFGSTLYACGITAGRLRCAAPGGFPLGRSVAMQVLRCLLGEGMHKSRPQFVLNCVRSPAS